MVTREKLIQYIEDLCETLGRMLETPYCKSSVLKREIREEFLDFLIYLAICDGEVSPEEARVISEFAGKPMTRQEIWRTGREEEMDSLDFALSPPRVFRKVIEYDNMLEEDGVLSDWYLSLLKCAGNEVMEADGHTNQDEFEHYMLYKSMLEAYREENCPCSRGKASQLIKEESYEVIAPAKEGDADGDE